MKHHILLPLFALALLGSTLTAPAELKNESEKNGYALGLNIGNNLHRQGLTSDLISPEAFARGFADAISASKTPELTEAQVGEALNALQKAAMEQRKLAGEKAKTDGEKYLAANKAKPDVTTLPSGLQYKILNPGKGESPKAADTVTVNYRGTLIDGTEFDSSYKRGQPATFRVGGVIKGWTEALQLMQPGAKWQLFIPAELAYGERGTPGIPPNATLIFEVELVSFTSPPPPTAAPAPQPITSDIIRVPSAEEMKRGAKIETIKAEEISKYTNAAPKK